MTWKPACVNIQAAIRSLGLVLANWDRKGVFGMGLKIEAMESRSLPGGFMWCGWLPLPPHFLCCSSDGSLLLPSYIILSSPGISVSPLPSACSSNHHCQTSLPQRVFQPPDQVRSPCSSHNMCWIFDSQHLGNFVINSFWIFSPMPSVYRLLENKIHVCPASLYS